MATTKRKVRADIELVNEKKDVYSVTFTDQWGVRVGFAYLQPSDYSHKINLLRCPKCRESNDMFSTKGSTCGGCGFDARKVITKLWKKEKTKG